MRSADCRWAWKEYGVMNDKIPEMWRGELYDLFLEGSGRPTQKWHHYFAVYERHVCRMRHTMPTLMEIGVAGGGSLHIWRKYFGKEARIIGVDINPRCRELERDGFEIFIGDQSDPGWLRELAEEVGALDIVIDDGGHTSIQTINTFEVLYPRVREGGVYIVEDLHTAIWPRYIDRIDGMTFLDHAKAVADRLTWWHIMPNSARYKTDPSMRTGEVLVPWITRNTWSVTFYDSICVFERRSVPEPWNDRK